VSSHLNDLLVKYGGDTFGIHCQIHTKSINAMCENIKSFLMLYELRSECVFVCVCVCRHPGNILCDFVLHSFVRLFSTELKICKIYYTSNFLLLRQATESVVTVTVRSVTFYNCYVIFCNCYCDSLKSQIL